ncbi:hypothetical protein BLA13014_08281 [Burkholderia aenigmatica]|uniref:Uncharacterized protein n=1 Tax=Burkholderia aenigmatica TaxID=2015348 RepID=A0A6P2SWM2_9BURK|nr:hypothetical protein BLA13014_08281 [Burkholderia aenigmatica]
MRCAGSRWRCRANVNWPKTRNPPTGSAACVSVERRVRVCSQRHVSFHHMKDAGRPLYGPAVDQWVPLSLSIEASRLSPGGRKEVGRSESASGGCTVEAVVEGAAARMAVMGRQHAFTGRDRGRLLPLVAARERCTGKRMEIPGGSPSCAARYIPVSFTPPTSCAYGFHARRPALDYLCVHDSVRIPAGNPFWRHARDDRRLICRGACIDKS